MNDDAARPPERSWTVLGERITCKVESRTTGGAYSLIEIVCPPGVGPPLHVHHGEDEVFHILEGELLVQNGSEKVRAAAGGTLHLPKDQAHAYRNIGAAPARFLVLLTPGGFEDFFDEVSRVPVPAHGPPDMAKLTEIARRYQLELAGPPLEG